MISAGSTQSVVIRPSVLQVSASRRLVTCHARRLLLRPSGDGDTSHIEVTDDFTAASTLELKTGALYELGRVQEADLVVPLPTVSARHAALRVGEDGSVTVMDLGSTNGTYVDGNEIEPMAEISLSAGSEVSFGDKHLASFRLEQIEESEADAA